MCLLGLGDSGRRSLNQALIMEEVDERYRGRVMSVYMMNFGLMPLGMLPAGLVADWLGGQAAIGILAFLLFGVTLGVMVSQGRLRALQ
jgi:MFS family permease